MPERDLVVIGAFTGRGEALGALAGLPWVVPASVLIVAHTLPTSTLPIPDILACLAVALLELVGHQVCRAR